MSSAPTEPSTHPSGTGSLRDRVLERLADAVLARPRWVIAVNVLLAVVLGWQAVSIRFDTAPDIWFLEDDPTLLAHDDLEARFGSDRWIVVAFEAHDPDVITNEALATVKRVTEALEADPHIIRVRSLTSFEVVRGSETGLDTHPLVDADGLPLADDELGRIRDTLRDEPIALGLIVAPDLSATAVVAELSPDSADLETTMKIVDGVYAFAAAESERSGFELRVGGGPVMEWAFFTISLQDNRTLLPALYGFIALVLFAVLRRTAGVAVALLVIVLVSGTTFGAFSLAGLRFNNLTAMLPMILLAVSIANGVHVLVAFYGAQRLGMDRHTAVRQVMLELARPCFLSSFTTAVGFASLTISPMPPLRAYGAVAALGVMLSFFVALTFVPAVLCLGRARPAAARAPTPEPTSEAHEGGWIGAVLALLGSA